MPNFFGCWFFDANGIYDGYEWDSEEIEQLMRQEHPALLELDEEEQSDEYWDLWSENIWELVAEKQYEVYQSIIMELNEEQ
jgi:hypothetical protein